MSEGHVASSTAYIIGENLFTFLTVKRFNEIRIVYSIYLVVKAIGQSVGLYSTAFHVKKQLNSKDWLTIDATELHHCSITHLKYIQCLEFSG